MEFPDLGKHCNHSSCNRLDFLPMKCDSCDKVFCSTHFNYEHHACQGVRKDVQVPVCPVCNEPIPTAPGVSPDLTVGAHIDQQCKSEKRKIYTNRCNVLNCKRKELIPVQCPECKLNYCLRHRHTTDHECRGKETFSALAANAAESRRATKPTTLFNSKPKPTTAVQRAAAIQRISNTQVQSIQGNMTEDEALARALAVSIYELDEQADRNRRNEVAAAAQRNNPTVPVGGRDNRQSQDKDKCLLS